METAHHAMFQGVQEKLVSLSNQDELLSWTILQSLQVPLDHPNGCLVSVVVWRSGNTLVSTMKFTDVEPSLR